MNIVITGIPRSGTTLVCHLLNRAVNTIALHEPHNPFLFVDSNESSRLVGEIDRFFSVTRDSLLRTGSAPSKQIDGKVPDNPKSDYPAHLRLLPNRLLGREIFGIRILRSRRAHDGFVKFSKPLSNDFALCVKHNAAFTALLGELTQRYPCFAVVRNPVATIASWNTIDFDLRHGHMTITDRLDAQLAARLAQEPSVLSRQIAIVEWFYSQYTRFLGDESIIKYEALVASPTDTLCRIVPNVPDLTGALVSKNLNWGYNRHLMRRIAAALLARPSVIWDYYPRGPSPDS